MSGDLSRYFGRIYVFTDSWTINEDIRGRKFTAVGKDEHTLLVRVEGRRNPQRQDGLYTAWPDALKDLTVCRPVEVSR